MKISIYDRIPMLTTAELLMLNDLWSGMVEHREKTPRHDYHGKCLIRISLELERRKIQKAIHSPARLSSSSGKRRS